MNPRRRCLAAGVGLPAWVWMDVLHVQAMPPGGRPQQAPWLEPRIATRYTAS